MHKHGIFYVIFLGLIVHASAINGMKRHEDVTDLELFNQELRKINPGFMCINITRQSPQEIAKNLQSATRDDVKIGLVLFPQNDNDTKKIIEPRAKQVAASFVKKYQETIDDRIDNLLSAMGQMFASCLSKSKQKYN